MHRAETVIVTSTVWPASTTTLAHLILLGALIALDGRQVWMIAGLFVIREALSGTILLMGRIMDPAA